MRKNRAFFLDRDGVIIKDVPYLNMIEELEFLPGVEYAIKLIKRIGYKCIVITNQSGIARGLVSLDQVNSIHQHMEKSLRKDGAIIDAFYLCPHHPGAKIEAFAVNCDCRKPKPGMFYQAAKDYNVDLTHSVMVGDKVIDIEAGQNAGCESFQLNGPTVIGGKKITFRSLKEVVEHVLIRERGSNEVRLW